MTEQVERDTEALVGSQKLGKKVRVIQKVSGTNPDLTKQCVYIYCGLYEVPSHHLGIPYYASFPDGCICKP